MNDATTITFTQQATLDELARLGGHAHAEDVGTFDTVLELRQLGLVACPVIPGPRAIVRLIGGNVSTLQRLQNEYRSAMGNGDVPGMMVALRKIEALRTADRLRRATESSRRILAQVRLLP